LDGLDQEVGKNLRSFPAYNLQLLWHWSISQLISVEVLNYCHWVKLADVLVERGHQSDDAVASHVDHVKTNHHWLQLLNFSRVLDPIEV
jgi:hypothetical protein